MANSLSPGDMITAGAFSPSSSGPVATAAGHSGLFHFPFRIHAEESLREHEGEGRDFRYRVYPPFLVRSSGSPLTDDVPKELWPSFRWHDAVPPSMREISAAPDLRYSKRGQDAILYDGLRVDIWSRDAANRLRNFVLSALRWVRNLSGQPWISDVDRHYASTMKRSFPIDASGAAVHEAIGVTRVKLTIFEFVTNVMWKSSFRYASQTDVPVSSNLYFDAINAAAIDDYPRAVMNLSMALEASRDDCFSRVYPCDSVEGRGPRLKPPFDSTDLLKHLSVHAESVFGCNLRKDHPEFWTALRNLYIARHHVAHGKGAVFPIAGRLTVVNKDSFLEMQASAVVALKWMHNLSHRFGEQSSGGNSI
jgi:hypothetical protein